DLLDRTVLVVDHQRRDVVAAQRGEVEVVGRRGLTGLGGIEDAPRVPAGAAGWNRAAARHVAAVAVGHVARAGIGSAGGRAGDEATGPRAGGRHAAGRLVDRRRI